MECEQSSTYCTKCKDTQFSYEGKCYQTCDEVGSGYGGTVDHQCVKCDLDNCLEYDEACQCTKCADGYYIISHPIKLIEICIPCQLENYVMQIQHAKNA